MNRLALSYFLLCSMGLHMILSSKISAAPLIAARPATTMQESSPSPTPSPTPDTELDQAKRDAALAEERKKKEVSEKDEAEARRNKLKAETEPFGDTTKVNVPTGSVTTDQAGFVEAQMLGQEAAREITNRLAKFLRSKSINVTDFVETAGADGVTTVTEQTAARCVETVVIYNESDVKALTLYRSMLDQLDAFITEFDDKEKETAKLDTETDPAGGAAIAGAISTAIAAPGIATGIIKSVAELVNLFRTDTEFKNKSVNITEDMVISYLVHSFNDTQITCTVGKQSTTRPVIYYPALYPPNLLIPSTDSELIGLLKEIGDRKVTAKDNIDFINERIKAIQKINSDLADLKAKTEARDAKIKEKEGLKDPKCKTKKCKELKKQINDLQEEMGKLDEGIQAATGGATQRFKDNQKEWLRKLNDLKAKTQFLIDSADQITSKLNAPDDATKLTPMAQLLRAERLKVILEKPSTFLLRVAVTANGTTKIKKNLFVDAKVRHSAGANLVYQLFDKTGRVVMGDTMQFYYDYKSSKAVREEVESKNPY